MISVVLAAHNEEGFLAPTVGELLDGLRARGTEFEIVVVENGSTDGTREEATRLAAGASELRSLSLPDPDYGAALRAGLLDAGGEIVVNFDVDYYDLTFLDRAVARLGEPDHPAIVVGSKRQEGSVDNRSWSRKLVTLGFTTILHVGFGLTVSDTHGMKAMRREAVRSLAEGCRFRTDLFDTELVIRAERAGLGVVDLPVEVTETRPARTPILKRVARSLVGLARMRWVLWRERSKTSRPQLP
ncbi:MAG: glycosyltransferase family 2 protein [Acidimicrobiia bacterium]|nr:glycosyltransferase family 2 protein [Acidimicrobiia bacterium]